MQAFSNQPSRPCSRHKRHIEMPPNKPSSVDRKTRKRRTLEKVGATVVSNKIIKITFYFNTQIRIFHNIEYRIFSIDSPN